MNGRAISVVIPSWNGLALLEEHLPSVIDASAGLAGAEVIVVDDGSNDGTGDAIPRRFPSVRLVPRAANGGFGPAANDGVEAARGEAVLLLNSDVSVAAGTLERLLETLNSSSRAFACVPSIVRRDTREDEALTRMRFRRGVVSTSLGGIAGADPAYACGGAMAFRRRDFLALGGFDPLFAPFYWEDVDHSYRARKRGRRILHVASAAVLHDHGRTIGTRCDRRRVQRTYERNRLLFTWKNLTDPAARRKHAAFLPLKLAWDLATHRAFVAGFRDAWALRREAAGRNRRERSETVIGDRELLPG